MNKVKYVSFAVIPLILLVLISIYDNARGPYYLNCNSDPTYYYLVNCLNVANFQWPHHIDNPGSTVQIIGGTTMRICGFINGVENLERDILLNPEYYLNVINKVLAGLNLLALFFLGAVTFKLTGNLLYGYLLQLVPFVSWQETLRAFIKVTPESMIFFSGILLVILLLVIVKRNDLDRHQRFYTISFALVVAFGLASKLTFVPMAIIPLVVIPRLKWKLCFIGLLVVFFHLMIIPAWGYYGYLWEWATGIFIHSGHYGTGESMLFDIKEVIEHFKDLVYRHHTYLIFLTMACVFSFFLLTKLKLRSLLREDIIYRIFVAIILSVLMQVIMVLKHYDTHYLLPAFMVTTFLIYLLLQLSKKLKVNFTKSLMLNNPVVKICLVLAVALSWCYLQPITEWVRNSLWAVHVSEFLGIALISLGTLLLIKAFLPKLSFYVNIALIMLLVVYHIRYLDIPGNLSEFEKMQDRVGKIATLLETKYSEKTKVFMCCSSSKYTALWMGASINFPQTELYRAMGEVYKDDNVYFLDFRNDTAYAVTWTGELIRFDQFLADHQSVVINGHDFNLTPRNIALVKKTTGKEPERILGGGQYGESIYLLER